MTRVRFYSDTAERWFTDSIEALGGTVARQPDGVLVAEDAAGEDIEAIAASLGGDILPVD